MKLLLSALFLLFFTTSIFANTSDQILIKRSVDKIIQPLMAKYKIPGMAVAVTINNTDYFFNYGIASNETGLPVTNQTLFEIGSITKTFTATLESYFVQSQQLRLSSTISEYFPELSKSALDKVTLLNLPTHTSGLPLFVPENIKTQKQFINYLTNWKPRYKAGAQRIYSNIGFGLLGMVMDREMHDSYADLLSTNVLNPLGLHHTFIRVPYAQMSNYAESYTKKGKASRMSNKTLLPSAYALKSSSSDLIKYVQENMQEGTVPIKLEKAIQATHTGYYETANLTQDLGWEEYPYPVKLNALLKGNGPTQMSASASPINPPLSPQADSYINKTGASNGFRSYVAFVPQRKIGVVILANKVYPGKPRITAGYKILSALSDLK